MTTGKTIALTRWNFVGKVMSLLFNMLSQFSSVQSLSCVQLFATPWIAARQASLSITNSRSSLILTSIQSVMPSSHLILCRPLLLLPPIPPSIRVFSNESNLHMRWPKYWSFSFSISASNEHLGLISFRMDWLDLLAVQGTLKSLFQHHSSKASIHFPFSLSCIGEGNGNPLQCSCLENPREGGASWAAIHGVAQSQTRLKRLSSSRRSFLYGPTLTSIHDYWEKTIALTR